MSDDPPSMQFLDTNVLVYAYDNSAELKHEQAVRLVENCWETESGCISIQVLQEFYVTVTKKISKPLDKRTTQLIIADLEKWRVHSPTTKDLLQAIDLQQEYQISFWDAQIVQSAAKEGCTQLLSEDLNHGQWYGVVQVINPFIR